MITRAEIELASHLQEASKMCREFATMKGFHNWNIKDSDYEKLKFLIDNHIQKLAASGEYRMIYLLKVDRKIIKNKDGVFITCSSDYFRNREAISFNHRCDDFIGFCAEMSGCNRIPFILGFLDWLEYLETSDVV
jgi:hypothetical protein